MRLPWQLALNSGITKFVKSKQYYEVFIVHSILQA